MTETRILHLHRIVLNLIFWSLGIIWNLGFVIWDLYVPPIEGNKK